jgi:hypothetical protein
MEEIKGEQDVKAGTASRAYSQPTKCERNLYRNGIGRIGVGRKFTRQVVIFNRGNEG